jgi:hypothetical protein
MSLSSSEINPFEIKEISNAVETQLEEYNNLVKFTQAGSLIPAVKNHTRLEEIQTKILETGCYLIGTFTPTNTVFNNFLQRVCSYIINSNDREPTKKSHEILVMKIDVPNHHIGLLLDHSLNDLFQILVSANQFLTETKYIELMIEDKVNSYFNSSSLKSEINLSLFKGRLFGSGKNFSKVTSPEVREQLLMLQTNQGGGGGNYPDQAENPKYIDDYPLVFHTNCQYIDSVLNQDHDFNLSNIDNMIDCLDKIGSTDLLTKLINSWLSHPETSNLVRFNKFRSKADMVSIAKGFHHQLVMEQMMSNNFEGWNQKDRIKLWSLDELQNVEIDSIKNNWYVDQIPKWKYLIHDPLQYYTYNHKVPTNQEATHLFHKVFSKGLLDFSDQVLKEFYSDNLVVGGSAFAFCACVQSYDKSSGVRYDYLSEYNDSDIDCPILAGTKNYLTPEEFEQIVDQKLKILQNNFPGGWNFRKIQKDKKFQIINDYGFRTLELFQVPYSLDDVWKHYAKYHFGWVRGYFDGYTWHILPSGVTSVLSRLSLDIRYCSTKHAPQELIFKYIKRGFHPILNDREMKSLQTYIFNVHQSRWPYFNNRGYRFHHKDFIRRYMNPLF